jgi:riboflavin kinase/FMN adenylyltransferase
VRGDQLGKKIGFPTANVQLKHNRPPLSGIFVVEVEIEAEADNHHTTALPLQQALQGVASLGVRPTVHEGGKPVLEVYLFNFNQDIYGRHLRVHFLHKLRDEKKYPDLATLTQQIDQDVRDAKQYFNPLSLSSSVTR